MLCPVLLMVLWYFIMLLLCEFSQCFNSCLRQLVFIPSNSDSIVAMLRCMRAWQAACGFVVIPIVVVIPQIRVWVDLAD